MNIKGESNEKTLAVPGTILNDNKWHSIRFIRKTKQVSYTMIYCKIYNTIFGTKSRKGL